MKWRKKYFFACTSLAESLSLALGTVFTSLPLLLPHAQHGILVGVNKIVPPTLFLLMLLLLDQQLLFPLLTHELLLVGEV